MFPMLADAVDELVVPVDGRAIAAAIALRDRVDAKIAEAVGHFDAESLWDLDAVIGPTSTWWSTSMPPEEPTHGSAVEVGQDEERLLLR